MKTILAAFGLALAKILIGVVILLSLTQQADNRIRVVPPSERIPQLLQVHAQRLQRQPEIPRLIHVTPL